MNFVKYVCELSLTLQLTSAQRITADSCSWDRQAGVINDSKMLDLSIQTLRPKVEYQHELSGLQYYIKMHDKAKAPYLPKTNGYFNRYLVYMWPFGNKHCFWDNSFTQNSLEKLKLNTKPEQYATFRKLLLASSAWACL